MTVEEARKILGPKYENIPDEEISKLICFLTYTANFLIDKHIAEKEIKQN